MICNEILEHLEMTSQSSWKNDRFSQNGGGMRHGGVSIHPGEKMHILREL
jgi:hypothetical protein